MNTCTFVGRIPRDAELKDVGANKVSNFSIGSDVGFGEKKKTMWIECGMWGKRGEALNDSLKKGQQVILGGVILFCARRASDAPSAVIYVWR